MRAALDALEARDQDAPAPTLESAGGFVALVTGAATVECDSAGLGRDLTFAQDGVAGSGLVNEGELIQLTAFPRTAARTPRPLARSAAASSASPFASTATRGVACGR